VRMYCGNQFSTEFTLVERIMRIIVHYRKRVYGNHELAKNYSVAVTHGKNSGDITVSIKYDEPATGFGSGETAGSVEEVVWVIPAVVAREIAAALTFVVTSPSAGPATLEISEDEAAGTWPPKAA
jgi:hypothetical protein